MCFSMQKQILNQSQKKSKELNRIIVGSGIGNWKEDKKEWISGRSVWCERV